MDAYTISNIVTNRVVSPFDMKDPSFIRTYFQPHGEQGMNYFSVWMEALGYTEPIPHDYWDQWEESFLAPSLHCNGSGATDVDSANGLYSFVLSNTAGSSDFIQQSNTSPYPSTPAAYSNPAQVGMRLKFTGANAGYYGTVENVTGGTTNTVTVTFRITNGTVASFNLLDLANREIMISGTAYGDGTDMPNGFVNKPITDRGYLQLIKSNFAINGGISAEKLRFDKYSDGKGIEGFVTIGTKMLDYFHAWQMDNTMLFEKPSTNMSYDTNGEPRTTTEGLDSYIDRKGNPIPYVPGSFTPFMFNALEKILDQQNQDLRYYCMMNGISIDQDITNALQSYFKNTDITNVIGRTTDELFGGDAGMAAAVNFRQFQMGYTTYCFSRMPSFNNPRGAGMTGYNYPYTSLGFPLAKKKDSQSGNMIPYFGMKYKKLGDYSRKAEFVPIIGASNGQHQTPVDKNQWGYKSHIGAQHCGGESMFKFYKPAA